MEESGIVFDIARFSLHDGDGIRTTVFLKGCPLRCLWCHNPESQKFEPEVYPLEGDTGDVKTIGSPMSVSEVINVVMRDLPYYKRSGGGLTLSGGEPLAQPDFSLALLREAKIEVFTPVWRPPGMRIDRFLNEFPPMSIVSYLIVRNIMPISIKSIQAVLTTLFWPIFNGFVNKVYPSFYAVLLYLA